MKACKTGTSAVCLKLPASIKIYPPFHVFQINPTSSSSLYLLASPPLTCQSGG